MNNVEEIRERHIKKMRRYQWIAGALGIVYALTLLVWYQPILIFLSAGCGILCLLGELVVDNIRAMPAHILMEFERLTKKWKV